MVQCVYIDKKKKILCAGALNKRIQLLDRALTPDDSSPDFTEVFANAITCKASIQTTTGVDIFNGTEIIGTATHVFSIKYKAAVTAQKFILFKDKYYDILSVENVNEADDFLLLRSRERGDTTVKANWA